MKDYYKILEISPDASSDAIKEQYRFLVQAWHPDKFPNPVQKLKAEEKLKEINEAYDILYNPAKRAGYDSRSSFHQEHNSQQAPHRQTEDASQKREDDARRTREQWRKEDDARRNKEEQWRKEDDARRAKEEQWRKENANKSRAEDIRSKKIHQLDQEIMLKEKEIKRLNEELPRKPISIFGGLFLAGGFVGCFFSVTLLDANEIFRFVSGAVLVFGVVGIFHSDSLYAKANKLKIDEINMQKYHLEELIRERQNLV